MKKILAAGLFGAGFLCVCVDPEAVSLARLWLSVFAGGGLMLCGTLLGISCAQDCRHERRERIRLAQSRKKAA